MKSAQFCESARRGRFIAAFVPSGYDAGWTRRLSPADSIAPFYPKIPEELLQVRMETVRE
jgi:hypothetical protein